MIHDNNGDDDDDYLAFRRHDVDDAEDRYKWNAQ